MRTKNKMNNQEFKLYCRFPEKSSGTEIKNADNGYELANSVHFVEKSSKCEFVTFSRRNDLRSPNGALVDNGLNVQVYLGDGSTRSEAWKRTSNTATLKCVGTWLSNIDDVKDVYQAGSGCRFLSFPTPAPLFSSQVNVQITRS